MKIIIMLLIFVSFKANAEKLYSFDNYPELLQQAISNDIHKPNPNFITTVDVPSNEVSPSFIAQLKFDKVKYLIKPKGELTNIQINYNNVLMSHQVYRNTYLHMIGMRIAHYSRTEKCDFAQFLNKKDNEGFKERFDLLRTDFKWLRYASSNLQISRDIDKGLKELSKFCETKEMRISKIDSSLYKYGLINYNKIVEIPVNPQLIPLQEILKYDFFKIGI